MSFADLGKYDLQKYESDIRSAARQCTVGEPVDTDTKSFFGGLPYVDYGFVWPTKKGYPLNFVGQLDCAEIDYIPVNTGNLLFFYDNRHWGYSPADRGHAVVFLQSPDRMLEPNELPETQVTKLFGLIKRSVKPKTYQKVHVTFREGFSYPSWERKAIPFENEVEEECYDEFLCAEQPVIQIGGYPSPIQTDEMELDCIRAFELGKPDEWLLLLQLFEFGDMIWGDAGALYWFIHKNDLASGRFDRVWMVTQCH